MADITLDKLRAVLPPGVTVSAPLVGGQGGQGTVFRGSCNGTDAAIKVFKTDADTRRIDREIELLSTLNCPHVVRLLHHLGAVIDTEPVRVLAYELHTGGDLNQHLRPGASTVTAEEVLRIGAQVATAIDTLWSKRIVHRDIKPANIVRAADGRYVLVDVGFARHLDRYEGEHEMPDDWRVVSWVARNGYCGLSSDGTSDGNRNRERERLWFSPHCLNPEASLFGAPPTNEGAP